MIVISLFLRRNKSEKLDKEELSSRRLALIFQIII